MPAYRRINDEIDSLIEEVNWKYETEHWKPIIDLRGPLSPLTVMALRRLADFAIVSSLHDGMNLVAKEFVASSIDDDAVTDPEPVHRGGQGVDRRHTGEPLRHRPFGRGHQGGLEMPLEERQRRMRRMRAVVQENNVYKWAADIVTEMVKLEFGG